MLQQPPSTPTHELNSLLLTVKSCIFACCPLGNVHTCRVLAIKWLVD